MYTQMNMLLNDQPHKPLRGCSHDISLCGSGLFASSLSGLAICVQLKWTVNLRNLKYFAMSNIEAKNFLYETTSAHQPIEMLCVELTSLQRS